MTDAEQKAFAQGRAAGLEEEHIHCMFVEWYAMTQVQPAWSKDKGVPAAEWLGDIMKEKLARADRPRGSVDARFGVWCETGDYLRWEARELFSQFKVVFELARSALSPNSSDAGKDDARDAALEEEKFYVVLNPSGTEGVLFKDKADADFTATGDCETWSTPTIGEAFRESYADDGAMTVREVCLQSTATAEDCMVLLREAAKWLHSAYDIPPQTPECKDILSRIDAALSSLEVIGKGEKG